MKLVSIAAIILSLLTFAYADNYDYIVAGGGTAGAILAARLSDDPTVRVLLLERGQDDSSFTSSYVNFYNGIAVANPISWALSKNPLIEDHYSTETTMGFAKQYIPSPITLGGGSSDNGNAYTRPTRADFARFNSSIWTFDNLLPDIKALEQCQGSVCNPVYHGLNGPIIVNTFAPDPVEQAFFWAFQQAFNISVDPDFNDGTAQGVGFLPRNLAVVNGSAVRQDSYTKVLRPVLGRPNLVVKTKAKLLKLELDLQSHRHTVVYMQNYNIYRETANREVILSTGAYHDPRLLMLSGIGNCTALATRGITCVVNNPQVGQNLHESASTNIIFAVAAPVGPSAVPGNIPCVYSASQWYVAGGGTGTDQETAMSTISPDGSLYLGDITQDRNDFNGEVVLLTDDPFRDPLAAFNLNPTADSVLPLVDQIMRFRAAMQIAAANLSNEFIEVGPSAAVENTVAAITSYLLGGGSSAEFHYVGTCSIQKVVNDRLQLIDSHGRIIWGLRVASNSIVPELLGVHGTCAMAQIIGQVAARLIKEDWR